jgi:hypothetical protein
MKIETKIHLNRFHPRPYQLPLCHALESGKYKRLLCIWPRRAGKDVCAFNLLLRQALRKIGVYYYVFPEYSQARKVIWDSITTEGVRFLDYIPQELIQSSNSQQMKITLTNGSLIQLVGSDNIDSLMGSNPIGIIFSEYALQDPQAYKFLRPILLGNDGWSLFISTPRGKNHLWELYQIAINNPENWFASKLTILDTDHITPHQIQKEISEGLISEDFAMQEFYTSFDMGVEGAYYAKYIDKMRVKNQIGDVNWESAFKVHVAIDIGVRDSTCLIFFQNIGQTIRIIDTYENSKVGLEHYVQVIRNKPYLYGKFIAPHDVKVQEWGSGLTRIEKARQLGIDFTIAPDLSIVDGIEAVRSTLDKVWIDKNNCKPLIKALENYRQEWDSKKQIYKPHPLHDKFSHFCFAHDTMVLTRSGMRPIISIRDNEEILTANGWEKCIGSKSMRKNANLVQVVFVDGVKVRCTPDHLFLTESGWISAENLKSGSQILSSNMFQRKHLITKYIKIEEQNTITELSDQGYTVKSGVQPMVIFRQIATFITKIVTQITTSFQTLFAFLPESIEKCLNQITRDSAKRQERPLLNGMEVKLEEDGTVNMQSELKVGKNKLESLENVCSVESKLCFCKEKIIPKSSATQTAKHLMVEKIEKLEGMHEVWCINVPISGHFSLANGAIVSNSDAMRYLCIALPKTKDSMSSNDFDKMKREAIYGEQNMPQFFRNDLPNY